MAMGPDNGESSDSDAKDSKSSAETLSPKARRIKKQIADGSYQVDLESLADHLLDEGVLEDRAHIISLPSSDEVKNDQLPATPSQKDD